MREPRCFDDLDEFGAECADEDEEYEQDIVHRLIQRKGSNLDDVNAGESVFDYLSSTALKADEQTMRLRFEAEALADPRTASASTKVTASDGSQAGVSYVIEMTLQRATGLKPVVLAFTVGELGVNRWTDPPDPPPPAPPSPPSDPPPIILSATSVPATGGTSAVVFDAGGPAQPSLVLTASGGLVLGATTYVDATHATVVVPAHAAGTFNLIATQASGTMSAAGALTIVAPAFIDLALRSPTVYLVSADYSGAAPAKLLGRASAGASANANYRRDLHGPFIGGGGSVDPGTVTVGGKTWLVGAALSAGALMNAAGTVLRNRSDLFGATSGSWSLTVAASWGTLAGGITIPRDSYGVFGGGYSTYLTAISSGSVGIVGLNAAGSAYSFVALPASTVVVGVRYAIQAQFDGTNLRLRARSGGVTGAWSSPAAFSFNAGAQTQPGSTMDKPAPFGGPTFTGEFGGAYLEQIYATDMDDVLAAFCNEVGLP